jgi:hypothetical protein
MRENRVRENVASNFVNICRIEGKINLADIFTKEMKGTTHFVELHNLIYSCVSAFNLDSFFDQLPLPASCCAFKGGVSIYFKYCHSQS